jgi:hypothetical protein
VERHFVDESGFLVAADRWFVGWFEINIVVVGYTNDCGGDVGQLVAN